MPRADANVQCETIPHAPEHWIEAVCQAWRAAGTRITAPRRQVLRHIAALMRPFTAEQLYANLQSCPSTPGRATVYRTLEQLTQHGWVARIYLGHTEPGYSLSWPGHTHHLICRSCSKVVVFQGCVLDHLLARLAQQTNFAIEAHMLELVGCCADCRPPRSEAPTHNT